MEGRLLAPKSLVTKERLAMLENNLVAQAKVNRQFDSQFVKISHEEMNADGSSEDDEDDY